MALHSAGKEALRRAVTTRQPFTHGNLSGRAFATWEHLGWAGVGSLPEAQYPPEVVQGRPFYVIFSYRTPIAWIMTDQDEGWTVPPTKYSVTTTNHQSAVSYLIRSTA